MPREPWSNEEEHEMYERYSAGEQERIEAEEVVYRDPVPDDFEEYNRNEIMDYLSEMTYDDEGGEA